ncbi:MAG: aspartate dehydrogenase [Candidatus Omnitrophota bacterium]
MKSPQSTVHGPRSKPKIGIIGCGTIGSEIAKACLLRLNGAIELTAICDIDREKASALQKTLGGKVAILGIDGLIEKVDVVVEAASAKISGEILEKAVRSEKDLLVMSVGGLIGREPLLKEAAKKGVRLYIPSGAICGIDGLKSASVGKIDSVRLTTRKPLKGLAGAPYLKEKGIEIDSIKEETVIFEGNAKDAIRWFPQNVNVSAVLSLAGLGAEKTEVRIVTSPDYTKNIHEVEIRGSCGVIRTVTENVPSAANPKTSALAILSAIATLEGITKNIRIGT